MGGQESQDKPLVQQTQRQISEQANARIRDTAKWLIAAYAAIGAVLIAGSQLTNLGRLCLGCGRLLVAILGVGLGIYGVARAIWLTVGVLVADALPLAEIEVGWANAKSAIYRFFSRDPVFFQGFKSFADIRAEETKANAAYEKADEEWKTAPPDRKEEASARLSEAREALTDIYSRSDAVVSLANQIVLADLFKRKTLRGSLLAVVVAAIGIGLFAWAANPPASPVASLRGVDLSGADLTGANLRGLDLSGAVLSRANLSGADLRDAELKDVVLDGVTWDSTTCPDGTNSDAVGGTCENHLGA